MKKSSRGGARARRLVVATVVATGGDRGAREAEAGSLTGAGRDVPVPAHLEVDPGGGRGARHQDHLLADRLGCGHRGRSRLARSTSAPRTRRSRRASWTPARAASSSRGRCLGTSVPYNLPGLNGRLRLTGPVLARSTSVRSRAGTTSGSGALNPGRNLPDLKITPVFRSDGSGTTYNFTEYLSAVSPTWKDKVGFNTSVSFPTGIGAAAAPASPASSEHRRRADLRRRRLLDREQVPVRADPEPRGQVRDAGCAASRRRSRSCRRRSRRSPAEDRRPAAVGGPARLPDLDVHVRDRADSQSTRPPTCGSSSTGR